MKTTIAFIKTKLFFVLLILFPATVFFYSGCNKDDEPTCDDGIQNQSETGVDCGGPCAACPSCSDGIQNQDETGIDCGGSCPACPSALCDGNGQNQYLPLTNANYWKYSDLDASSAHYSLTINGTQVFGSYTYNVADYCFSPPTCLPTANYYYRTASNGDVYQYFPSDSAEYLLIPANPTVNQNWPFPVTGGTGTRKVMSVNESVSTYDCAYTGCLKIQEFNSSNVPWKIYFYKKGVGLVYENAGTELYRLVEITQH